MIELISKVHCQNYETGEFSAIAARSLEETRALVKTCPWETGSYTRHVGLDMQGLVIEDAAANYLKIGNYYDDKYRFYLYTHTGKYFTRIVTTMEEVLAIVDDFFNGKDIEPDFHREHDIGVKKNFISKDFIYRVTFGRVLKFLLTTILATIPFTFFLVILINTPAAILIFLVWLLFCGINWLLFVNYFMQSGSLFLKVSEGQNKFFFGSRLAYREYDKEDIENIFVYAWTTGSKGPPWIGFEVYKLVFKNGMEIRFTSLLISSFTVPRKFSIVPQTIVQKFLPFCKMGSIMEK